MIMGQDCIGVCVIFLCHDGKGNFLMARRSANVRDEPNVWDFGGGGIEFNETIEDALRREIKEEYNRPTA
ncbi:NUDIX hydrolase [Candidatus Falkowbacteria bacterium]|nr:NUDIX hydrolase [Candidatus Falkowbacteria bacterium]